MYRTAKTIFVYDSDRSEDYISIYRAEADMIDFVLKIDNTMKPPYYSLFREYKEGKRILKERLFESSNLEKVLDFADNYLGQQICTKRK